MMMQVYLPSFMQTPAHFNQRMSGKIIFPPGSLLLIGAKRVRCDPSTFVGGIYLGTT
jgi:hypothetical protein